MDRTVRGADKGMRGSSRGSPGRSGTRRAKTRSVDRLRWDVSPRHTTACKSEIVQHSVGRPNGGGVGWCTSRRPSGVVSWCSAARAVLTRDGVAGTTLRAVAAEAGVPLGTLHYVFPSKELLITAVIEDVREEVSAVLMGADKDVGLEHAIRRGLQAYWEQQIVGDPRAAPDAARAVPLRPANPRPGEPGATGRSRATAGSSPSGARTPRTTPARSARCPSTPSPGPSSAARQALSCSTRRP